MKSEIESAVQWLRDGADETQWRNHIRMIVEAVTENRRTSGPLTRRDKAGPRSAQVRTYAASSGKMRAALPHIELMLSALRRRNRHAAIKSGTAALAALDGTVR